ncbi:MAG TPA: hypothetical protein ENI87_08680 [bacterium]|nr:hypothetical protein [bacterium]
MDLLLALLHVLAYLSLAFALVLPRFRRIGLSILTATAAATLVLGREEGERSLTTLHHYAGFQGADMEVSMVGFETSTFTAAGGQWTIPFAAFALSWILLLWRLGRRELRNPWILPLTFAWTAAATWLGMQVLAAPSAVVQPVGIDRFLWPAGLALCLLAARRARSLPGLLVAVGAGILAARLPLALFSWYASTEHLGTSLDVHTVRDIVNPMTQMQFDPRLAEGSGQQFFYLIWLEHVIFFPAVYLMSLFGIAFGAYMFHRHGEPGSVPA